MVLGRLGIRVRGIFLPGTGFRSVCGPLCLTLLWGWDGVAVFEVPESVFWAPGAILVPATDPRVFPVVVWDVVEAKVGAPNR